MESQVRVFLTQSETDHQRKLTDLTTEMSAKIAQLELQLSQKDQLLKTQKKQSDDIMREVLEITQTEQDRKTELQRSK